MENDALVYKTAETQEVSTIAELVKKLYDKKLIDGVGFQSHWDMNYPDTGMISDAMQKYSEIGDLEIQFTEVDMHNTDDSEEGLKKLADRYKEFFEMIVKADREGKANVTSVTFWGLSDDVTWLTSFKGEDSYPLLFDESHKKKACYDSVLAVGNEK